VKNVLVQGEGLGFRVKRSGFMAEDLVVEVV
jgi:hypothetical protein